MDEGIPAAFMRGGTSNAVMLQRHNLPPKQDEWGPILASIMGSPDPYGRQLNGMGGGLSSLSKVCVISPSQRPDADVDFTFVQVDIKTGEPDFSGTCGNMTSAVGPFAYDHGLVRDAQLERGKDNTRTVRIFNTNTSKIVNSTFEVCEKRHKFNQFGSYSLSGVSGTSSKIALSFVNPGGSKTASVLPTGNAQDILTLKGEKVHATLIDSSNPCVLISGQEIARVRKPATVNQLAEDQELLNDIEELRKQGAQLMGLQPAAAIPKIALLYAGQGEEDLIVRAFSMEQPHRAVPVTVAGCIGVASHILGTSANIILNRRNGGSVRLGHPTGFIDVDATVSIGSDGKPHAERAILYRTARTLMEGRVFPSIAPNTVN